MLTDLRRLNLNKHHILYTGTSTLYTRGDYSMLWTATEHYFWPENKNTLNCPLNFTELRVSNIGIFSGRVSFLYFWSYASDQIDISEY